VGFILFKINFIFIWGMFKFRETWYSR